MEKIEYDRTIEAKEIRKFYRLEYKTWKGIKARCYNTKSPDYKLYGGRGIVVHEDWKNDFIQFLTDMGQRPSNIHSIDRINGNGNYSSSNCKWSTPKEQSNNRRSNRIIEYKGESLTASQWSDKLGIEGIKNTGAILKRISRGWSIEKAFTVPSLKTEKGKPRTFIKSY